MSPEQVRGQALDRRSDVFNLGLILYEMLAGARAFRGDSAIEVLNAILKEAPAELPESVPGSLRQIVVACLEKNPANRFESARDIAFALRALSAGSGPIKALPQLEAGPLARRRAVLPVYAALAAAVILAAVFAALYFTRRPERLDLSAYKYTPFATEAEYETNGAWSPDGRSIAYLMRFGGSNQLMVRSLDTPSPAQLTKIPNGLIRLPLRRRQELRDHCPELQIRPLDSRRLPISMTGEWHQVKGGIHMAARPAGAEQENPIGVNLSHHPLRTWTRIPTRNTASSRQSPRMSALTTGDCLVPEAA